MLELERLQHGARSKASASLTFSGSFGGVEGAIPAKTMLLNKIQNENCANHSSRHNGETIYSELRDPLADDADDVTMTMCCQ